jgi:integrase
MSVHQLKDGRWIVRYYVDKKQRTKYFGRGLAAESEARRFNDDVAPRRWQRRTPRPSSAFFRDLVNDYIQAKAVDNQVSTITNLMIKMEGVILPRLGDTTAIRITSHQLDRYVAARIKAGVKNTTIHRELTDVMAVLNWAVAQNYISFNPVAGYKKPKRDDAVIQPPTTEEIKRLIAHSAPHLVRALALSFNTGIRPGQRELLALCWHNLDKDAHTLWVESAKKGGQIKYRNIPLGQEFMALLAQWYADDQAFAKRNDKPVPERIIHYRGKPVKKISKAFAAAKKKAKITRRLRPYDFRHAFATAVLSKNSNLKATSEILGHSRTDTTTRIYQHTDTAQHRSVIDAVPDLDLDLQKS